MSTWKAAGITYVRFSAIAAGALKRGLNAEAIAKRAGGSGQNIIARQWANGKPNGDFIIGNKVMEAL
ncbi:Oidioi.mRNA.OKI2018_I69.chr2.g5959.t1.cds [Oikopleura dioica]|uniref:Oidioi.mRNA.OKI2018_I69.chr2.g5959.t1.cds n=1 Tax=Oikopleura dioica TaxID=34765 RepID=A0ABN7T8K6_OIKDI|nr:Oidioi.mRNA.OKI2018_I69.chr2.g5959.t1.cds [Oikopleura dioica]